MGVLLDQGLPRSAAVILRARGLVAAHVGELGMACATDPEILAVARARGDIVVTLDADFHALLASDRCIAPSVIRIRVEGLRGPAIADLVVTTLAAAAGDLERRAVVSVTAARTRVRALPLP